MLRILIVGGGIGGLTLASLLERRIAQADITLAEQAPSWAPLGAGITLTGNALRILDAAGLGDEITQRGLELESSCVASGTGSVLIEASNRDSPSGRDDWSSKVISIHRASLHEALLGSVTKTDLRLGSTIEEIQVRENLAQVRITGESEAREFDVVVGADGVNSSLRRELFGAAAPPLRYAGYTCWRGVVDMSGSAVAVARRSWEIWAGARRMGIIPLGDGHIYFYACLNARENDPRYQGLHAGEFADLFEGVGGPAPEVLEAIRSTKSSMSLHHDDLVEIKLPTWHQGPLVLIGDAAHAMTPNLGQGAAMAIEDATALCEELAKTDHDRADAAKRYEDRRRPRVDRLQKQAFQMGRMAQWQFSPACWLRNFLLSQVPASFAARQLRTMIDEEV